MIVLDTNVISEAIKTHPDPAVVAWLESLTGDVTITAVTLAELLAGIRRLPEGRRRSELDVAIDGAIQPYSNADGVLPFDQGAAEQYADVLAARERVGLPIHTADAQIAAICRAHGAICATRNTKDFAQTGVDLINPWG